MRGRLPPDEGLTYFLQLGTARSYSQVASYFRVHKSTVQTCANRHGWQAAAREHDKRTQERVRKKVDIDPETMNENHLVIVRHVLARALEGLRSMPLKTPRDCLRAIELAIEQERKIIGDGSSEGEFLTIV